MNTIITTLAAITLVACSNDTPHSTIIAGGQFRPNPWVYLYVDPETKCEYLSNSNNSSLTPRYGRNGKQICRGEN